MQPDQRFLCDQGRELCSRIFWSLIAHLQKLREVRSLPVVEFSSRPSERQGSSGTMLCACPVMGLVAYLGNTESSYNL